MVNYFIYAKDYSTSTNSVAYYHENGLKTLSQFKSHVAKLNSSQPDHEESRIIYLHWGHECVEVDEETTVENYINRCGTGTSTTPETIIEWIKENIDVSDKIKLLYIITDGWIYTESVKECLLLNENVEYEIVVFHGIQQNLDSIDLSVAASFFKKHITIYRNNELLDDIDISEEFDYDKITIDNFATEIAHLSSYIKFKMINSSQTCAKALAEIDKLKNLRNKLFMKLSSKSEINLDTKDKNKFIQEFKNTNWYKILSNTSNDLRVNIEKSISVLINYIVSDKKSYAFDALKFQNKFYHEVPEETIDDVYYTMDQAINFPDIILDDEKGIPVILFTKLNLLDKIIFKRSASTGSFSKFKVMMECPLFMLSDPDLNDSVGYFYTLNVYKQLVETTSKREPRTRKPFYGGIVLVDTDDFDKYNDYILSGTYFNHKKVDYNIGLFYFVLWKICESKEWMDKNVVEQFKKYMLRRVSTTVCKIGLSSLPLDPQANVLLPTALWYCVELSSHIFKDDPDNFKHERLRMFYSITHSMIEILNYFQYDLDLKFINKRKDLIRHVVILKKIPLYDEKVFYFMEKIFKNINGFLVSEISNKATFYVNKLNYLKLNHREMLNDNINNEEVNLNNYVHMLHHIDDSEVKICEKTLRPYFMIDENNTFYSNLCKKGKRVEISKGRNIAIRHSALKKLDFSCILSFHKYFLLYVKDKKEYPTLEEYTEYILKKKKFNDGLVTIFPVNVITRIEEVFLDYERIIKDLDVRKFVKMYDKYVGRIDRIKAENIKKFESDDDILEFLAKEDSKYISKTVELPTSLLNINVILYFLSYLLNYILSLSVSEVRNKLCLLFQSIKYSKTKHKKLK